MNLYDITIKNTTGTNVSMSDYKGKVLLIVNTATACGFTPQYQGLQALYEKHRDNVLEILDFPCNQFGGQAPGSAEEIESFCTLTYGTTFPRFAKVDVIGEMTSPLFHYLTENTRFEGFDKSTQLGALLDNIMSAADSDYSSKPDIKWNFTKFLINRDGSIVKRFEPTLDLEAIDSIISEMYIN